MQTDDNRAGFVMCSAHSDRDHDVLCEDQGNLKYGNNDPERNPWTNYDTERLVHMVGQTYCGLKIMVSFHKFQGMLKTLLRTLMQTTLAYGSAT